MNKPHPYEVWRLPFTFEENPSILKERPVVIGATSDEQAVALALKVTGHGPRLEFPGEIRLQSWEAIHL